MTNNENNELSPNELAFIALTNEYCQTIERIHDYDRNTFVATMVKLLPRIFITADDLEMNVMTDAYIEPALKETQYEQVRQALAQVMADEDVYLEVFLDDMKYSDTPISAMVSENLADLYQEFYNMVQAVQYASSDDQSDVVGLCYENFTDYWGQTLCNVLRALHHIKYTAIGYDGNL
ncbi:MAG: DUF5063 domain-containing protein [Muribaculaceae bacterium]|nr:DUF5063 domain-containing protein [Muribaculaceae bacterium]